jgi:hypothetical protein
MPGTISAVKATGTFPVTLSTKFTEMRTVLANLNEYSDGSSQRASRVTGSRKSWKLSKRLTPVLLGALRDFWKANPNTAFYFFNPRETDPPFSLNPSGTAGRYTVRFASDWEETVGIGRSDASVELIEVGDAEGSTSGTGPGGVGVGLAGASLSISTSWVTQPPGYTGYPIANYSTVAAIRAILGGLSGASLLTGQLSGTAVLTPTLPTCPHCPSR